MSVERLTKREALAGHNVAYVSDEDCFDVWSVPKKFMGNAIDRLATIEDILGDDYDLDRLRELIEADRDGRCFIPPFIAMVEQSLTNGKMKPQRDQRFNGRYAVVYFDREKYAAPLIDVCGKPYDRIEAENRMKELRQKEALSELKRKEFG